MKKLLLIVLLTISLSSKAFISQTDKQLHMASSFVLTTTFKNIYKHNGFTEKEATIYSIGSSLLVGLGKEIYDEISYGGFSTQDLGADLIGTILSEFANIEIKF